MTAERTRGRTRRELIGFGLFCAALGIAFLVVGLVRGDVTSGVVGLAIMLAYVLGLAGLRGRSETAVLLSGAGHDERQTQVMLRACAVTGQVLALVLVGGLMVSTALDAGSRGVFSGLCAVTGIVFVAATAWFSRRG